MIIFTRYGFLVLLAIGAAAGIGFALSSVVAPGADNGPVVGICLGFGLLLSSVLLFLLNYYVILRYLDRPTPMFVSQPLAQPVVDAHGRTVTHQPVPVVNQQTGEQLYSRPRSTFFFIPTHVYVVIFAVAGLALIVVNAFRFALA